MVAPGCGLYILQVTAASFGERWTSAFDHEFCLEIDSLVWERWTSGFDHEFCLEIASLVWERWTSGFDHEFVLHRTTDHVPVCLQTCSALDPIEYLLVNGVNKKCC